MAGAYIHVNDTNFDQDVLKSDVPVLVDFWAPWCGPCRAIAPHVEALSTELVGKARVAKCNVDESPGVAMKYGIRSIPTILVFKGGAVVKQRVGAPSSNIKATIGEMVTSVL
jgi:thioredoxin 1